MKDIAAPPPQSRADSRLRRRIAGLLESQTLPDGRKIFLPPYSQTEKAFVNRFAFQRADYPAKPAFDCRRIPAAAAVYPRIRALRLAGAKPIYGKLRNAFAVPAKLLYFPENSAEIFYRASAPLFSPRALSHNAHLPPATARIENYPSPLRRRPSASSIWMSTRSYSGFSTGISLNPRLL